jgi:hypothetical protein
MTRLIRLVLGLSMVAACGGGSPPASTPASPNKAPRASSQSSSASPSQNLGTATDIELLDANGSGARLATAWADQDAVVVFYRGHW